MVHIDKEALCARDTESAADLNSRCGGKGFSTQVWRVLVMNSALNALAEDYPAVATFCRLPGTRYLGRTLSSVKRGAAEIFGLPPRKAASSPAGFRITPPSSVVTGMGVALRLSDYGSAGLNRPIAP